MTSYSVTRKLLHWLIAFVVIGLFASGYWMVELDYYSQWYTKAPHWHKSIGLLLLVFFVVSLLNRKMGKKPDYDSEVKIWERIAAKIVQTLMSVLVLMIILTGYLITTANGDAVSLFNWFDIPAFISDLKNQEDLSGKLHKWMAYLLMGLVTLHAGAALFHHFIKKDRTLIKMLHK